tara:strand:- start:9 stop:398 length:390 start_codon:yes stop_codon:yes gene_type:complete
MRQEVLKHNLQYYEFNRKNILKETWKFCLKKLNNIHNVLITYKKDGGINIIKNNYDSFIKSIRCECKSFIKNQVITNSNKPFNLFINILNAINKKLKKIKNEYDDTKNEKYLKEIELLLINAIYTFSLH